MEKSNIHEKIKLLTGNGMWHTQETEDLPSVHLSDGPHGLRKQEEKERQNNVSLFPSRRYSGTIRMEKEDGNVHYYLSSSRVPPLYSDYCWLPCYNILT